MTIAYKGLGNCYYYLSNKPAALAAYEKYLSSYPDDFQIKALRDKLAEDQYSNGQPLSSRDLKMEMKIQKLKEKEAREKAVRIQQADRNAAGKIQVGINAVWAGYSMSSWNNAVDGKAINYNYVGNGVIQNQSVSPMNEGAELGLNVSYGILNQLSVGADLEYWILGGSITQKYVGGGVIENSTLSYSMNTAWVGPDLRWRITPVESIVGFYLEGGAGYMMLVGAGVNNSYSYVGNGIISNNADTASDNGSGFGYRGIMGLEFGNPGRTTFKLALEARTGHINSVQQTVNSGTSLKSGTITDTNGAAVPLDYTGLGLRLSLARAF